jgi:hypothetical protein
MEKRCSRGTLETYVTLESRVVSPCLSCMAESAESRNIPEQQEGTWGSPLSRKRNIDQLRRKSAGGVAEQRRLHRVQWTLNGSSIELHHANSCVWGQECSPPKVSHREPIGVLALR